MPTEVRPVGGWKVLPIRDLQICRSGRHESIVPPKPNNTDDLDAALRGVCAGNFHGECYRYSVSPAGWVWGGRPEICFCRSSLVK